MYVPGYNIMCYDFVCPCSQFYKQIAGYMIGVDDRWIDWW